MVKTSCQELWELDLHVKPEPALKSQLKDPREGGCLWVWAPPEGKRMDRNPGLEPFFGE